VFLVIVVEVDLARTARLLLVVVVVVVVEEEEEEGHRG